MTRPVGLAPRAVRSARRPAYTLLEILVATALSLILMAAVVEVFADVSGAISSARDTLEMSDRLRTAAAVVRQDVEGCTLQPMPPIDPREGKGYLQITEGDIGPLVYPEASVRNIDDPSSIVDDSTAGDLDDMLLLTTRTKGRPFVGRFGTETIESKVAEVAYFVRGGTLYRRTLLVSPGLLPRMLTWLDATGNGGNGNGLLEYGELNNPSAYALFDVSCHLESSTTGSGTVWHLVPNTLGDLTKLQCRFGHWQDPATGAFPGHPHQSAGWSEFGLPTLRECTSSQFFNDWWTAKGLASLSALDGTIDDRKPAPEDVYDPWLNPLPWANVDPDTGDMNRYLAGERVGEDVLLTNVLGFDVKVWDPGAPIILYQPSSGSPVTAVPGDPSYLRFVAAMVNGTSGYQPVAYGAYVDLNYLGNLSVTYANPSKPNGVPNPQFAWSGFAGSGLRRGNSGAPASACVYDTWSTSYESDGINQDSAGDSVIDEGTNGFDDDGTNGVDDPGERETSPPYPYPLRGIQLKIRTFDPSSRQIREVTVVHDFLPK